MMLGRRCVTLLGHGYRFTRGFTHSFLTHKKVFVHKVVDVNASITLKSNYAVGKWFIGLAGMTFGAVFLGGVTSYALENGEMSLSHFKFIWFMEYLHRTWGRLIGVAFVIPSTIFMYKGYFTRTMKKKVFICGLLIGLQGLLGWLMVRSGLKEPKRPVGVLPDEEFVGIPRVGNYWLCGHLLSAVVLYSIFLWNGFNYLVSHPKVKPFVGSKTLKSLVHSTKLTAFLTIAYGALVAGLDAGLVYNSWPKMADRWIPEDLFVSRYGGWFRNMIDNPTNVQFFHRIFAYTTVTNAFLLWLLMMRLGLALTGPRIRFASHLVLAAVLGQSLLGITTLIYHVPTELASMHQCGSLVLFSSLLWLSHCLKIVPK